MNIVRQQKIVLFGLLMWCGINAKVVDYIEDAYMMQAPQEIVNKVDNIAQFFEFDKSYEIVVPKKPGLQVNPWNRFVAYGINPASQNPFVIINPEWFSTIPEEQQTFLLGRYFLLLKHGAQPFSMKVFPFVSILLRVLLLLLVFWILGKTRLAQQKTWLKIVIAYGIVVVCNILFLNKLEIKLMQYLGTRYDAKINEMVVQKTDNRDVAIKALEYFDVSIKKELQDGETFWKPYETSFESYAHQLKKTR